VKVSGVQIVPDPVEPGKPATFKISASTGIVLDLLVAASVFAGVTYRW
jgi:hypothetical protein